MVSWCAAKGFCLKMLDCLRHYILQPEKRHWFIFFSLLAQTLSGLPLPEDHCLQELRELTRSHLMEPISWDTGDADHISCPGWICVLRLTSLQWCLTRECPSLEKGAFQIGYTCSKCTCLLLMVLPTKVLWETFPIGGSLAFKDCIVLLWETVACLILGRAEDVLKFLDHSSTWCCCILDILHHTEENGMLTLEGVGSNVSTHV